MKKLLFLTAVLTMTLLSCEKPLKGKVYVEDIYKYDAFDYFLIHRSSDCKSIKSGVYPIDTTRVWWNNDYYEDGLPVRFCSDCLNDEEIDVLDKHRDYQKKQYENAMESAAAETSEAVLVEPEVANGE